MIRTIALVLLCLFFHKEGKDDFNFPDKYYRLNMTSATVDSVISIFGSNCCIDTTYNPLGPEDWAGTSGQIKIDYESEKLHFIFRASTSYPFGTFNRRYGSQMKFKLLSIDIKSSSSLKFGKNRREPSEYGTFDLIATFGQPDTIGHNGSYSFYTFRRASSKRQYSFWFNDTKKMLMFLQIKPTD